MTQTLNRIFNEEKESYLYYNEALLSNNVIIKQSTFETDEGFQTIIDVLHYNDMDAVQYTIYWSNPLAAIQVYQIVKDIHALYIENTLGDFLQLMYDFVWDTIVGPFVAFLAGGFTQAFGAATEIVNALSPVFEKVGGWISKAAGYLREFTSILGKVKVPDWIGNIGSGAVSWAKKLLPGKSDGAAKSHYSGISEVPYNSYYARLHKGERVLTAQENKSYDQGNGSSSGGGVVITGNNFTVREEADIEKIAYGLAKLIERERMQRG
ncbi:hypothetical protein [Lysinibacillus sp. ZYM-1]|uniref:hypothetical protein n=1 Tax=Lysinibacillus sp. ZYM-1 TaxID=1681184 RepID=UPI0006CE6F01|nr:hypothetical protein [Lysinibacillus sp. ZYM-1]KPN89561.1 hypothetical protein AO843_07270 [Lysinibacillus sp. ZYM-1]